jgi:nicotinamidase-related amidase
MRGAKNAELYGPLQEMYLDGRKQGTDVWVHKNRYVLYIEIILVACLKILIRMGGLWGPGTALQVYLQEEGIKTLFFSGVNTDQVLVLFPQLFSVLISRQ